MKKIFALITLVTVFAVLPFTVTHAANPLNKACDNPNYTAEQKKAIANSPACAESGDKNPISGNTDSVLYKITRMLAAVAAAIAVIIIIIGGISMMTSGGDSQKFANGRNTLIFAAVGLVVIVLAEALITFVVNRFV